MHQFVLEIFFYMETMDDMYITLKIFCTEFPDFRKNPSVGRGFENFVMDYMYP